jgi:Uma2 family endonuclease
MLASAAVTTPASTIVYPESDGQPMAENTLQLRWIVTLVGNLRALYRDRADVFVGGDQFWYPVEGEPDIRTAPDVYVVFGRPKGERPSYQQWLEDEVPMTVVFEILSPGNSGAEMADKLAFYDDYGAEEYYLFDPDGNRLHGYGRRGETLARVRPMNGFVSPRLGIRFDLSGPELVVYRPDGRPFLTFEQLEAEREQLEAEREQLEAEREQARQQAAQAERRAESAEQRAARLAELSARLLRQEATPQELLELQRLLQSEPSSPG